MCRIFRMGRRRVFVHVGVMAVISSIITRLVCFRRRWFLGVLAPDDRSSLLFFFFNFLPVFGRCKSGLHSSFAVNLYTTWNFYVGSGEHENPNKKDKKNMRTTGSALLGKKKTIAVEFYLPLFSVKTSSCRS